ncbi:GIY-YIG nuclease family protein [Photobacterium sp. WH77]|uniref:GIY-YIG nuclease family protein n=1 Tax=unclassified Photobacterium TaxID=2628852 RepID=UPI001EDBE879|nr:MULTISPECIES: GIY-YIG nuclease family protein [unclassified Photobacterium]MCG2837306.1 GIY-YIG nuclease family protein [Photobacterium sp. WH77]MCG2844922.1 GIY-YIG nuclease family protein [Photobacterium sp. WH80]
MLEGYLNEPIAEYAVPTDSTTELPFETSELRRLLEQFLNRIVDDPFNKKQIKVGNFKWGVYSFYDYDDEPIYVGQTKESLRTRIRRHLTNQRTDAVAMNVLDPFEVYKIVVYPLPQLEVATAAEAKNILDALEHKIYNQAIKNSKFNAILNEKEPLNPQVDVDIPTSYEGVIVSDEIKKIREHPDIRIARRTQTISRLAQVISERKVQKGLRKVLLTQAKRLEWLAQRRLEYTSDLSDQDTD